MTETRNTKQQAGERELAALLYELTRHRPDALPGWSLTCKRYAVTPLALIAGEWWPQAVEKARREGNMPLLLYRPDRGNWRTVWPAALHVVPTGTMGCSYGQTLTADPLTWWRMCKGLLVASPSLSRPPSPTRAKHWAKG